MENEPTPGQPAAQGAEPSAKPFMFAIKAPDGTPHMTEQCVSESSSDLEDDVHYLNEVLEEDEKRYSVVALYEASALTRPLVAAQVEPSDTQRCIECHDNDSPWLVCKHCFANGKCDRAALAQGAADAPETK